MIVKKDNTYFQKKDRMGMDPILLRVIKVIDTGFASPTVCKKCAGISLVRTRSLRHYSLWPLSARVSLLASYPFLAKSIEKPLTY